MSATAAIATAAIVTAMLLVRWGWSGRIGVAIAGWALAGLALVVLAREAGAWGVAIGALAGMSAALAIVLYAGWTAPIRRRRAPRPTVSTTLPRRPIEVARRLLVFVLVVPVAFAAAQCLAFSTYALAGRHGVGQADATALMLFLQPVAWTALMTWQMTCASTWRMAAPPAMVAAVASLLWSLS